MKVIKLTALGCFVALLVFSLSYSRPVASQEKTTVDFDDHAPLVNVAATPTEAPTGFDNLTNGLTDQATYDADRSTFEDRETIADGVGPVYNAQSCAECHQSPITGGSSQVSELRAGHFTGAAFVEHLGGSLINDRAINPAIQEIVLGGNEVRTFRMSTNLLGAGYVESIDNSTLRAIALSQPAQSGGRIAGQVINVPVDEVAGATRVGRFGWKNQHASLVSFAADAYLNEMGITTPLQPVENTWLGQSVAVYDTVADPEDDGDDLLVFARFMRATKAPARNAMIAATPDAQAGARIFNQIGCNVCHVAAITTAMPGTVINGGNFTVPPALGNKIIHPYSDFLMHDIGTGDGIVQNGGPLTRNKVRTAPLWGLRTRNRLLHDGSALTRTDAITQHGGEASLVTFRYLLLSGTQKQQVLEFLKSL